jgi:hypothetical protein
MKRITAGDVCCVTLIGADLGRIRELEGAQRIFDLRRALNASEDAETLFYRAVVSARFGQDAVAIPQLRRFLETHPDSDMERKAHEELASVLVKGVALWRLGL